MKIRPIFKTIDIFSFIQFLSRQINYIIKFFLLKVLYLVWNAKSSILGADTEAELDQIETQFDFARKFYAGIEA